MHEKNGPIEPTHPAPPPMGEPVEPGTRLGGRFVVLNCLGVGGGAIVVRARDEALTTTVAVKLLRADDPDLRRRFAREAELLANVKHPSIVQVLAHGEDAGRPYMALELLDGPDLAQRLVAAGPMPWRQVVDIGVQLADALATVHSKGLIHRDVKPANVVLVAEGEAVLVKLIDFGVARVTDAYADPEGFIPKPRRPTDLGTAIGTSGYLPLEAGLVPADERFDVFALGVTLYELLTGELPGVEPIRPLCAVNPTCDAPADLGHVLAAALALEPGDRTQSADELRHALEAIRTAHPERRTSPWFDGRYERLAVLGTGAKGDVYLANHRGGGHDVALKFLRSRHPDDLLRFEREARLLALFDAPGLPRYFDYAPEAERPYIAMSPAPGLPAARFCLRSDKVRLRPAEVAEVGLQLARTLALLHSRGVLHRDVNANNVMIDLRRDPRVTLIDLGCAALTDLFYTHASARYLTKPEARVGIPDGGIETLAWSAPEVRAGEGWTDKSDVYSLGLLLYRLVTGRLPTLPGSSEPVPVHRYAPACPEDLASIILRTLQPRPDDRPSADHVATQIQETLEDAEAAVREPEEPAERRPAAVQQPPAPDRSSQPSQRQSASPLAVAPPASTARRLHAGIVLVAVGAIFAWWVGRATAPPPHVAVTIPAATQPAPSPTPTQTTTPAPVPAMRVALASAAPRLRACAVATGGLLVDFTVAEGGEQFTRVAVIGAHVKEVHDCVRAAVADLRFAPTTAQTFTEDYIP